MNGCLLNDSVWRTLEKVRAGECEAMGCQPRVRKVMKVVSLHADTRARCIVGSCSFMIALVRRMELDCAKQHPVSAGTFDDQGIARSMTRNVTID